MSDGQLPLAALRDALMQMPQPISASMGTPNPPAAAALASALPSAMGSVQQPPPPMSTTPASTGQTEYGGPSAEQLAQAPTGLPINLGSNDQAGQVPQRQNPNPIEAIRAMFGGGNTTLPKGPLDPTHAPVRPVSRLDAFEGFLGNFLNSFAMGMSQAGQGPGAPGRGFAGAVLGPYQQQLQQYQLGQQQRMQEAQIQLQQAEAQQRSQQVMTPYGMMPVALAQRVWPAGIGAQARVEAAGAKRYTMNSLGQVLDTHTGQVTGPATGGVAAGLTVTPQLAAQYEIPNDYIGKWVKNSDLVAWANRETRDTQIFQTGEGPRAISKTAALQGGRPTAPLGTPPAVNAISQARLDISTAEQAHKIETNQGQVVRAIDRIHEVLDNSDTVANLVSAGKISMQQDANGAVHAIINRGMDLTDTEAKVASAFQNLHEDINLLRLPLGAAGFRGEQGWQALQSQMGTLAQNPKVFKDTLSNTLSSFEGLRDSNQKALDVYNRVAAGRNKAQGGGGGGGGKIDLDALANKYKPKGQ